MSPAVTQTPLNAPRSSEGCGAAGRGKGRVSHRGWHLSPVRETLRSPTVVTSCRGDGECLGRWLLSVMGREDLHQRLQNL